MKYLSLIICATALLIAGCKKKDTFKLEVESTAFSQPTDVVTSGQATIRLHLRDLTGGFGETVKITVENLPAQVKPVMIPDSNVIVTDVGLDVDVKLVAKNAPLNASYKVNFRFEWKGGSTTLEAELHIVPYNGATNLAGNYRGDTSCDSTGGQRSYISEIVVGEGLNHLYISNFAGLGEDVYVSAYIDSVKKTIFVPSQTKNNIRFDGFGNYSKTQMNISCNFHYSAYRRPCTLSFSRQE